MKLFSNASSASIRPAALTTRSLWKSPDRNLLLYHENAQPRGSKVLLIQQVKEYLQENYTQRITLNSAAALVYLTPTYLSKLFAEVEGMGFSEYLSALRIQHAKEALLDYHRRIYEIAAQVGYQDVKHFMKVFKKQVGMTPREYRESHLF
ncbi:hypothetical protein LAWASA_3646 [Lawsonibacter asaccharolyticus]|nr:hypothetical protein LAWASA_3646 [Lawsonibacter asaccharolyticus]